MKNLHPKLTLTVGAALLALAASSAQAAVIASDSFNQAPGVANGMTAGAGFTTNWSADGAYSVVSGSLTYADPLYTIPTSGNSLAAVGSWSGAGADFAPVTGRVWFSYLFKPTIITGFHQAGIQPTDSESFKVGMKDAGGIPGYAFSEHNNGGANGTLANEVQFTAGETYLMVGTYSTDGSPDSALYVNPVLGGSSPSLGLDAAIFSGTNWGASNIARFRMYAIDADWVVDNIVIGTTFESVVTAIPEPSSYAALLGLVGLGFAASRRRRA
jgi:hypothetical protein